MGDRKDAPRPGAGPGGRNLTYGMLDTLGRGIVTGEWEGRRFPTEAELAKDHGVSRSVTREAVKMLTAKGLVTARPRTGTTVQPQTSWNLFDTDVLRWLLERNFSLELLRQFTELRAAIEPAAAALAAQRGNTGAIEAGYARMAAAEHGQDDPLDSDIAFHVAVLNASGNPFYMQFRDLVSTALRTSIHFTNTIAGRGPSLPEHRAVLDAIRDRRPAQAHAAMTRIVDGVMVLIARAEESG
jgi:DNA-binding FadR family transcriptional regulator